MTRLLAKAESGAYDKDSLRVRDAMAEPSVVLTMEDDMAEALDVFGQSAKNALPVVDSRERMRFKGIIRGYNLMRAYHRALKEVRQAEHG
jgi:CBS-domain-containing membrane protein